MPVDNESRVTALGGRACGSDECLMEPWPYEERSRPPSKSWTEIRANRKRNVYRAKQRGEARRAARPHLGKMDDNRHFDGTGTQPPQECMQSDLEMHSP